MPFLPSFLPSFRGWLKREVRGRETMRSFFVPRKGCLPLLAFSPGYARTPRHLSRGWGVQGRL